MAAQKAAADKKLTAEGTGMNRKEFGDFGEQVACDYLQKMKYRIVVRNYRSPAGEIDIIAEKGGVLLFAEVKTRSSDAYGMPAEAVTEKKLQHIRHTAAFYLSHSRDTNGTGYAVRLRFDVIEIMISHIEDVI